MPTGQKRAPGLSIDGCEPPCGHWELNSGPPEEQAALLTPKPSLQPANFLSVQHPVVYVSIKRLAAAPYSASVRPPVVESRQLKQVLEGGLRAADPIR